MTFAQPRHQKRHQRHYKVYIYITHVFLEAGYIYQIVLFFPSVTYICFHGFVQVVFENASSAFGQASLLRHLQALFMRNVTA